MKVIKLDAAGNQVLDAAGNPVMIEIPDSFGEEGAPVADMEASARARAKEAADKAAAAEKRRMQKILDDEREARTQLEAQLADRDARDRQRELAALPPDQQVVARMTAMEHELAQSRAHITRIQSEAQNQIRQVGLVAYRERAIREVPPEVHHLVTGATEEEIDNAADAATNAYRELEQRIAARFQGGQQNQQNPGAQYAPAPQYAAPMPQYVQAGPVYQAPPPNPAYVPPVPPQYAAQAGFPTPTNPPQIPDTTDQQGDISAMTTEQAVRSGRYGGEMRERIHQNLKGNLRYPGALGSAPRHWSAGPAPAGHVAQPGGVMQPQGTPMGPVQPAGMPQQMYQQPQVQPQYAQPQYQNMQQPQYAPPPQAQPSPQAVARTRAQEAINRTHAGGNAIANGDSMVSNALQASQQFAQARGIPSPQAAFEGRFTPTPPITQ